MATGEGALIARIVPVGVRVNAEMDTHETAHTVGEEVYATSALFVGDVDECLVEEDVVDVLFAEAFGHGLDELHAGIGICKREGLGDAGEEVGDHELGLGGFQVGVE